MKINKDGFTSPQTRQDGSKYVWYYGENLYVNFDYSIEYDGQDWQAIYFHPDSSERTIIATDTLPRCKKHILDHMKVTVDV